MRKFIIFLWLANLITQTGYGENPKLSLKHALVLGSIQGITEFLPVSSTGHMVLANECFFEKNFQQSNPEYKNFKRSLKDYLVCIQLGTIATLLFVYRREIKRIFYGLFGKDSGGFRLGLNLGLAFSPVGICGFLFADWIHEKLYGKSTIFWALIAGALLILLTGDTKKTSNESTSEEALFRISTRTAIGIGIFQLLALWPGLSRSLMTILAGVWLGLSLSQSVHFSFLLGLLTSSVATGYKLLTHGNEMICTLEIQPMLAGIFIAMLFGFLTVYGFLFYLRNHSLKIFAYYRLFLAFLVYIFAI